MTELRNFLDGICILIETFTLTALSLVWLSRVME